MRTVCTRCSNPIPGEVSNPPGENSPVLCKPCSLSMREAEKAIRELEEPGVGEPLTCSACDQTKDSISGFYPTNRSVCKTCCSVRSRAWVIDNYTVYLWKQAKYRAKKKNLPFSILPEDILIPSTCPVLGIPLTVGNNLESKASSPTIDRVDNQEGYTLENIRVISYRANALKNNATLDELRRLVRYMERNLPPDKVN